MQNLIDILELSTAEIDELIDRANDIIAHPEEYREKCKYKKLATLFFEPSTRTRLSFEAAMLDLGGSVMGFSEAQSSSAAKGESVADTVRTVGCYADIIAMRHPKEGAPLVASMHAGVPVINAGDGGHNHPTQTLTDLLTIKREKGHFDNLTIGVCGDLKFGRTVHSLIQAMSRYEGIKFVLISPEELKLPSYVKNDAIKKKNIPYEQTTDLVSVMPELDILYMTRVQRERFFNEEDYIRLKDSYILTPDKLATAKEDLTIMHPLPRVNEISVAIDDDPRAAYFRQVKNGKFIRMALILKLLGL
ncbi:MAG: aspartate carbamoyltransferase [Lachnospiraceae bacterium]|nr:aspartate carbamoyltransferase [Lachnospiraceae bacterium]MBR5732406.1 aspartate carbamoyltransferase [Lachnospiraceae bacterium]